MAETPINVERANRWFAVEFNNRAWELVEAAKRSAEETEQMIHAAHAACVHWLAVGNDLNHLRAQCLLATAYAAGGFGEAAVRHAVKCLELCQAAGNEATTFDRATELGCASIAYACAGQMELGKQFYEQSLVVAAKFEDAEDRAVFDKFYPRPI
jgi:hypothetical protein